MERLQLAGQRPSSPTAATRLVRLHLCLFVQSVVDLDAEVSDGALKLRVPQQELDRSEILGPAV
jgi:hypothetical protein